MRVRALEMWFVHLTLKVKVIWNLGLGLAPSAPKLDSIETDCCQIVFQELEEPEDSESDGIDL